jgi:hypothetical protein
MSENETTAESENKRGSRRRRRIIRALRSHGRLSLGLILLVGLLVPLGCSSSREAKGDTTTDTREVHGATTPELHRVTDQEGNVYTITGPYKDTFKEGQGATTPGVEDTPLSLLSAYLSSYGGGSFERVITSVRLIGGEVVVEDGQPVVRGVTAMVETSLPEGSKASTATARKLCSVILNGSSSEMLNLAGASVWLTASDGSSVMGAQC